MSFQYPANPRDVKIKGELLLFRLCPKGRGRNQAVACTRQTIRIIESRNLDSTRKLRQSLGASLSTGTPALREHRGAGDGRECPSAAARSRARPPG